MKHTKKKVFIVSVTIILLILALNNFIIFPSLFGTDIIGTYNRHIGRRPNITGQITCNIYGKEFILNDKDASLSFIYDSGSKKEEVLKLDDGKFKRVDGEYGENTFILKLSKEFCMKNINNSVKNGLTIKFGYLTAPNWHKNNTKLDIYIEKMQEDETLGTMRIVQSVTGDDYGIKEARYILGNSFQDKIQFEIYESFI